MALARSVSFSRRNRNNSKMVQSRSVEKCGDGGEKGWWWLCGDGGKVWWWVRVRWWLCRGGGKKGGSGQGEMVPV